VLLTFEDVFAMLTGKGIEAAPLPIADCCIRDDAAAASACACWAWCCPKLLCDCDVEGLDIAETEADTDAEAECEPDSLLSSPLKLLLGRSVSDSVGAAPVAVMEDIPIPAPRRGSIPPSPESPLGNP